MTSARVEIRALEPGDESRVEALLAQHADSSLFLRRNLLVYGGGGLVVPFIGIKLIDLALAATGLA